MIPELDVINNKVCPYCGKPLFLNPKYHLIYSCEECAITVGYDDNKWSFIRIPFLSDDMSSKVCEIRLDRWRENIRVTLEPPSDRIRNNDPNYKGVIELPLFNVFAYSVDELEKRLNKLIVFS